MSARHHPDPQARRAALAALLADPATSWGRVVTCLACWPALDVSPALAAVEAVADRWPALERGLSRLAVRQLLARCHHHHSQSTLIEPPPAPDRRNERSRSITALPVI